MFELTTLDFDAIKIKLASPEDIHGWSHGEVTKPETINYRTQKPEKDGLFCERIFGPSKDWECYCGKYKKIRYKGIVCDKCGVEVTRASVRRQRMGHIDLAVPVSHIWFLRGIPSKIGLVLDLSIQSLEKVIYFANFIVTEVNEDLKKITIDDLKNEYKSTKKQLLNEFSQKEKVIMDAKEMPDKDRKKMLIELEKEKTKALDDLDNDFKTTEQELKELKPFKILTEIDYQSMALKYGHVFEANIGAEAVRKLLEKADLKKIIQELESQKKEDANKNKKLIKRIKLLINLHKNNINPQWMILTTIPVIPPDLRPMVALDGGRFATSDLNDLYRRVISRNNRLRRLLELNAPEVIVRNEKRMLQEAVDALIDNSARHTKTTTASTGQKRQLKSLADILRGKQGRFRQNLLGKRTDYSGRSVIVVGPKLKLHQCGIPKRMALELFRPFVISKLIKSEFVHNIRSANRFIEGNRPEIWDILEEITKDAHVLLNRAPTLHRLGIQAFQPKLIEGKAIQLHPLVCSAFNADFDGDQMAVHVLLTEDAKKEAREIMLSTKNLLKPATGSPVISPSQDMVWGCYYLTMENGENEKVRIFSSEKEAKLYYNLKIIGIHDKIKVRTNDKKIVGEGDPMFFETTVGKIIFNEILPEKVGYIKEVVGSGQMKNIINLLLEKYGFEKTAEILDNIKDLGFKYATRSGFSWGMDDLPMLVEKKELLKQGDKKIEEINGQFEMGLLTADEKHSMIIETWTNIKEKVVEICKTKLIKNGSVYSMIESKARGSWGQLTQMMGMKGLVTNPAGDIIDLPVKASFKEGFSVLEYYISTHGTRKGLADTALRTANAGYLTRRLVDVAQDVIINKEDCGDEEGFEYTKKDSEEMGETIADRIFGRILAQDIKDPKTKKVVLKKGDVVNISTKKVIEKLDLDSVRTRSILSCRLNKGVCKKCYGFDLAYNEFVKLGTTVGIIAAQSIGEPGTQLTMRTFHTGGVAGADITQGLPRVEELFESRPPKVKAFLAEADGEVKIVEQEIGERKNISNKIISKSLYKQKVIQIRFKDQGEDVYKISDPKNTKVKVKAGDVVKENEVIFVNLDKTKVKAKRPGKVMISKNDIIVLVDERKVLEYLVPPGFVIWVKDSEKVEKGQQLTEGSVDLQELYALKGKGAVQQYITKEVQRIYSTHGQKLNDRHIEVIIRQMFSRVYLNDSGDSDLIPGEILEKAELEEANLKLEKDQKQAQADELFLGISKVSLNTRSLLAAASFQETAKVLINAAVSGKIDRLEGLKENVIIGRLIPGGTGFKLKE